MKETDLIRPDWPAPANIRALSTTRNGGVSSGPWESLNLGDHCGDNPDDVRDNRQRLASLLPQEPLWMRQVHGRKVFDSGENSGSLPEADAAVTSAAGQVLAILTADCLPVLLCDDLGRRIGAVHAGWRGLAAGVIEAAVTKMEIRPDRLIAWLGPCIGKAAYEVGNDVLEAFGNSNPAIRTNLLESFSSDGQRLFLNLAGAARAILAGLGIERIYGAEFCTYDNPDRFYSYRRDGVTGRMASLIWRIEEL